MRPGINIILTHGGTLSILMTLKEMEGQVARVFYIRTNSGEDYSLKLIMKGKEEFKSFQPVFFGMIKSFKFGKGLF